MKRMFGFAVAAVAGLFVFRLAMGLVGLVFSLLSTLLWIALLALVIYFVLRIVSPETAERVRDIISRETGARTEVEVEVDEGEAEVVEDD